MRNAFRTLFAFTTLGITAASASQMGSLQVSVPFPFQAGATTLPAGDYTVSEQGSRVILIRGTGGSVILLGSSTDSVRDTTGLSFRHNEKGYFLESVHSAAQSAQAVPMASDK